jgi:hypothetical protein
MHLADEYASNVRHAGMLVIAVSVGLLAFGLWSVLAERRRTPAPPNAQPPTTFRPAASPADMWR